MIKTRNLTQKEINLWRKTKKGIRPSAVHDEQLLVIANLYASLTGRKMVMPCKCDGHIWKSWIAQIDRKLEQQMKEKQAENKKKTATKKKQKPRKRPGNKKPPVKPSDDAGAVNVKA